MANQNCRIRIVIDGRELEVEGTKAFVDEYIKKYGPRSGNIFRDDVSPGASRYSTPESKVDISSQPSKTISIREFIQKLNLKRHTEIVLAFGYYLEHNAGLSHFTPADINNCYYDAKMESSNTSQMLIHDIRRGLIMEAKAKAGEKGRKRYTLTTTGEKFIEDKIASVTA